MVKKSLEGKQGDTGFSYRRPNNTNKHYTADEKFINTPNGPVSDYHITVGPITSYDRTGRDGTNLDRTWFHPRRKRRGAAQRDRTGPD